MDDYDRLLMPDDVSHVLDHEFPPNNPILRSMLASNGSPSQAGAASVPTPLHLMPVRSQMAVGTKRSLLNRGLNRLTHFLFDDTRSRNGQEWVPKFRLPG